MPKKRLENTKHGSITVLSLNLEAIAQYKSATGKSKGFLNCICDCGYTFTASTYDITKKPHLLCSACNFKSFHAWCIENNRLEYLNLWDYQLNDVSPQEISYGTEKAYYFKCPRGIHSSQLCNIHLLRLHTKISFCTKCKSVAQWGIDNLGKDFLETRWSENNVLNPWQVNAGSPQKIWLKCPNLSYHYDYDVSAVNFTRNKSKCPACNNTKGKIHPLDSVQTNYPLAVTLWSETNKSSPCDYSYGSGEEVLWKCPDGKHPDFTRAIKTSIHCNFRCPTCVSESSQSSLQLLVKAYISENYNFTLLHERECTLVPRNPKYPSNARYDMPFDDELMEIKLIIEVHGIQHYEKQGFHNMQAKKTGIDEDELFRLQLLRDRYKSYVAYMNGYHYLAIPHWTESDGSYKVLIDNKIRELSN